MKPIAAHLLGRGIRHFVISEHHQSRFTRSYANFATLTSRDWAVISVDDFDLDVFGRLAGRSSLLDRIVWCEQCHYTRFRQGIHRGDSKVVSRFKIHIDLFRARHGHTLTKPMWLCWAGMFPNYMRHRAQVVELSYAEPINIVPELARRESGNQRNCGVGPKCCVACVPHRIAVEEWETGIQNIF